MNETGDPKRIRTSKSTEQNTNEVTESDATIMGPTQVCIIQHIYFSLECLCTKSMNE